MLSGKSSALSLSVADDLVTSLHAALSPHSVGSSPQPKSPVLSAHLWVIMEPGSVHSRSGETSDGLHHLI